MGKLFHVSASQSSNRNEDLMFNELVRQLESTRAKSAPEDYWLLVRSMSVGSGSETDGVLFRSGSVMVIELKNYEGDLMPDFDILPMDGNWKISHPTQGLLTVKGHKSTNNPFLQVKHYRNQLKSTLAQNANSLFKSADNVHVQAIVVFKKIFPEFNNYLRLNGALTKWFGVYDLKVGMDEIVTMQHPDMPILKPVDIKYLLDRFNLYDQISEEDADILNRAINEEYPTATQEIIDELVYPERILSEQVLRNLDLEDFNLADCDITEVYRTVLPPREPKLASPEKINSFHEFSKKFISTYPGLYSHQAKALDLLDEGNDVCLATSTASGKSEVFFAHALNLLGRDPDAKILVMYPMKALNRQQYQRWVNAFEKVGFDTNLLVMIDGSVPVSERNKLIKNACVMIATPDVVHAWFARMKDQVVSIKKFITNLKLVILDEAHLYNGVFGTNVAYLIRRLNSLCLLLGKTIPQYLLASGTLDEPEKHLKDLIGREIQILGEEFDGSPEFRKTVIFVDAVNDTFVSYGKLINSLISLDKQSITFTNGRVMAEYFTRAVKRSSLDSESLVNEDESDIEYDSNQAKIVEELANSFSDVIAVYRSGLDPGELASIQSKIQNGELKAVVSTSALEVGIDLRDLSVCILAGVPNDGAAFKQRLGRVGRSKDGLVIIINDKSEFSRKIFQKPSTLFTLPYPKSCIYLDNENIKKSHALCLYAELSNIQSVDKFTGDVLNLFHSSFAKAFDNVMRAGDVDSELGYDVSNIHIKLNLRDSEPQWELLDITHPNNYEHPNKCGTITYSQMMREAYPGAVYNHGGKAYRVSSIKPREKQIILERTRDFVTTKPNLLPPSVKIDERPNTWTSPLRYGALLTFLSPCFPAQYINGIRTGKDNSELIVYPVSFKDKKRFIYTDKLFGRKIRTTGFVLMHPELNSKEVDVSLLASLILNSYTSLYAISRSDVASASAKFRTSGDLYSQGDQFICLYDDLERGLNLCADLMISEVLQRVLRKAKESLLVLFEASVEKLQAPSNETVLALDALIDDISNNEVELVVNGPQIIQVMENSASEIISGLNVRIKSCKFEDGKLRYRIIKNDKGADVTCWVEEDELTSNEATVFVQEKVVDIS